MSTNHDHIDKVHYAIVPCMQFMTRDVFYYQATRYVTKQNGERIASVIGVFDTPEAAEAHVKRTAAACRQYDELGNPVEAPTDA